MRTGIPTRSRWGSADRSSKDKAWFFVAGSENDTLNLDKTLQNEVIDASFNFEAYIAKLSFQPSAKHQLSGSYIDAPAKRIYFHTPSHDRWAPVPHDLSGELATLSWNWSISSDFFLEAKLATQTSDENKYLAPADRAQQHRRRAGDRRQATGPTLPGQPCRWPALAGKQLRPVLGQP